MIILEKLIFKLSVFICYYSILQAE